jgi:hypothetical protein
MKLEKVFSYTDINFYTLDIKIPALLKRKILTESDRIKTPVVETFCHEGGYSESNITKIYNPGSILTEAAIFKNKNIITAVENIYPFKAKTQSIITLTMQENAFIIPHVDAFEAGNWRRICLSWALSPAYQDFAPTIFHNAKGDEIYKHFYDEKAFVLDTRIMHSVKNNNHKRVLFQVTFDAELADII